MTREQVAKRELVRATAELKRLGQEIPVGQFFRARGAVGAFAGDGLLRRHFGHQAHVKLVHSDHISRIRNGDLQAAREQGTGRVGGGSKADEGWRFDNDIQSGCSAHTLIVAGALLRVGRATTNATLVLVVIAVNQVFDGRRQTSFWRPFSVHLDIARVLLGMSGSMGHFIDGGSRGGIGMRRVVGVDGGANKTGEEAAGHCVLTSSAGNGANQPD